MVGRNNDDWNYSIWKGLPIILTDHAADRAFDLRIDVDDIAAILKGGYDCKSERRKTRIIERCSRWKGKTIKVIASQETSGWFDGELCWVIINVKPV